LKKSPKHRLCEFFGHFFDLRCRAASPHLKFWKIVEQNLFLMGVCNFLYYSFCWFLHISISLHPNIQTYVVLKKKSGLHAINIHIIRLDGKVSARRWFLALFMGCEWDCDLRRIQKKVLKSSILVMIGLFSSEVLFWRWFKFLKIVLGLKTCVACGLEASKC
jgi:hypothetical protein